MVPHIFTSLLELDLFLNTLVFYIQLKLSNNPNFLQAQKDTAYCFELKALNIWIEDIQHLSEAHPGEAEEGLWRLVHF